MTITASAQWWVRTDGDDTNGAGYDATLAGGSSVNYSDQAAAQLTLTDLATPGAGSTTLTSATGGFTDAMIGNAIRIESGTNFQAGWYFMTARASSNSCTLDRTPSSGGAGSSGNGKLGGAAAMPRRIWESGVGPITDGNTLWIRGTTSKPTSGDYAETGFHSVYNPGTSSARWFVRGYNGVPMLTHSGGWNTFAADQCHFLDIAFGFASTEAQALNRTSGVNCTFTRCQFYQGATSKQIVDVDQDVEFEDCLFWSSTESPSAVDTVGAISANLSFEQLVVRNCLFIGIRGNGIYIAAALNTMRVIVEGNIFKGCGSWGFRENATLGTGANMFIENNTFDGDAISKGAIKTNDDAGRYTIRNNQIVNHSTAGDVGLTMAGTQATNDARLGMNNNYNNYYNNTTNRSGVSAGESDTATDPAFTDESTENYEVTAASLIDSGGPTGQIGAGISTTDRKKSIGAWQGPQTQSGGSQSATPTVVEAGEIMILAA